MGWTRDAVRLAWQSFRLPGQIAKRTYRGGLAYSYRLDQFKWANREAVIGPYCSVYAGLGALSNEYVCLFNNSRD